MEEKVTTIPPAYELLPRLKAVDDNPYVVDMFYPRLLVLAGRELTGNGIALALSMAVYECTRDQSTFVRTAMNAGLYRYIAALTDDPEVQVDAKVHMRESGLSVGG